MQTLSWSGMTSLTSVRSISIEYFEFSVRGFMFEIPTEFWSEQKCEKSRNIFENLKILRLFWDLVPKIRWATHLSNQICVNCAFSNYSWPFSRSNLTKLSDHPRLSHDTDPTWYCNMQYGESSIRVTPVSGIHLP